MGCIEISATGSARGAATAINRNMGCIEIKEGEIMKIIEER